MELGFIAAAVKRYAWLVVGCALLGVLGAVYVAKSNETQYEARSVVLVLPPSNANGPLFTGDPDRYIDAEVSTMNSEAVQQLAVARLPGESLASVGGSMTFEPGSNSDVVAMIATTTSPVRSQEMANAFAEAYIEYSQAQAEKASLPDPQLEQVNQQLAALEQTLAELTQKIRDALPEGAFDLSQSEDTVSLAQRDATLLEYQRLLETKSRLENNANVDVNSEIIDKAVKPGFPVASKNKLLLALGLVGGLGLGVALALLRARFTSEVVDPAEVEETLGRPIASRLPRLRRLSWDTTAMALSPPEEIVAPLERLCVGLQSTATTDTLTVAVTGTVRGIGASTLAVAVAGWFARRGNPTVLIDADHVDPWLSEVFGTPQGKGLSRLLVSTSKSSVASMSTGTKLHDLRVLGLGDLDGEHGLQRTDVADLMAQLTSAGSVYVIDGGPMLDTASSLELARVVDALVVLMPDVRQQSWQLDAIEQSLAGCNVALLPVLTGAHAQGPDRRPGKPAT